MKVRIYSIRSFVPLFNGGEIFCVVMMTLGGGRAIITLRAAYRDRGRWLWEVICCHFILSFHSAGSGTWAMADCCDNVQDLLTSVNDLGNVSGWPVLSRSDAFVEVVRMSCLWVSCASPWGSSDRRSAPHVLLGKFGWGWPRMRMCATCHQEMCATCYQGEGSLQWGQFLTTQIYESSHVQFDSWRWWQLNVP